MHVVKGLFKRPHYIIAETENTIIDIHGVFNPYIDDDIGVDTYMESIAVEWAKNPKRPKLVSLWSVPLAWDEVRN